MKALFAGTFDPPTFGHLDLIARGSKIFEKLVVGVAENPRKTTPILTIEERVAFLSKYLKKTADVFVIKGLTINFVKEQGITCLLRGVRTFTDLPHEFELAFGNKTIGGIETLFLPTDPKFSYVSSSLIREIALNRHNLKDFVPQEIEALVVERIAKRVPA